MSQHPEPWIIKFQRRPLLRLGCHQPAELPTYPARCFDRHEIKLAASTALELHWGGVLQADVFVYQIGAHTSDAFEEAKGR